MKISLLHPDVEKQNAYRGLAPGLNLIECALKELGHEVERTDTANRNVVNLTFWQFITDGQLKNTEVLNRKNSAVFQVENVEGFLLWGNDIMLGLFDQMEEEKWCANFRLERERPQWVRWSENMNVWDYSIQNAPHFKGCNSYHVFDWGFQKDCFKPYWKEDASRGIAFYGGASDRRSDLLKQLANHVDIGVIHAKWGDKLFEDVSDYSFILSIGSSPTTNVLKASRFNRIAESLRMAEALHRGFFTLCERSDDIQQNVYWSNYAVVSPLLNLLPNAIDLLTDEKYVEVQQEKVTNFKEKTSMARTLERLLDETFT